MKKGISRHRISAVLAGVLLLLLNGLALAQEESVSISGRDMVRFARIFPRSGTLVLTPCRLYYIQEIQYNVVSLQSANLVISAYRISQNGKRQKLISPITRLLQKGSGSIVVSTPAFTLALPPAAGDKVLLSAVLRAATGKDLAYSTSSNPLAGTIEAKYHKKVPTGDSIQILSVDPKPGALLSTQNKTSFTFKIFYSVASVDVAFVSLEFCYVYVNGLSGWWYVVDVPLARGTGTVTVRVPPFTLSSRAAGRAIGIQIPFRVYALSGAVTTDVISLYSVTR